MPEVAETIQKFLVEPLDADVFISGPLVAVGEWVTAISAFPTLAQVRLERENVTQFLESAGRRNAAWREAVSVRGNWLGCYEGDADREAMRRFGSGLCQMYSHRQCHAMIVDYEAKRGMQYGRIVYSRPDFQWIAPHLPLDMLPEMELWIADGEDNGGLNYRHWVMPRAMMDILLTAWDRVLDGSAARWFRSLPPPGLPWLSTEIFLEMMLLNFGMLGLVRRLPVAAFVVCNQHHSRKPVDTSASGLGDSRRVSEVLVRCEPGGPKYKAEHEWARGVAECGGHLPWSWESVWRCWCAEKVHQDLLMYTDYRLCARAGLWLGAVDEKAVPRPATFDEFFSDHDG